MKEVLGDELDALVLAPHREGENAAPVNAGASGLNKLHRPDAVLFHGMVPVATLSGHFDHYMATMAPEEVLQQFPAFHIPLVAAFNWHLSHGAHPARRTLDYHA